MVLYCSKHPTACAQVSDGLRTTLRNSAITQNRGGFRTPMLVTDNATLHIENRYPVLP